MTDTDSSIEAALERWRIDISYLERELYTMITHRQLWRAVVDAIGQQAGTTSTVWPNHYTMLYVNTQTMAVRRLVRNKASGTSWFSLMSSIMKRSNDLTVEAFLNNA